jgi:hypothetical protein
MVYFLLATGGNDWKSADPVRVISYVRLRLKYATEESFEGEACRTMSRTVDILLYILFLDGGTGVCTGLSHHVHSNQIQDKGSWPSPYRAGRVSYREEVGGGGGGADPCVIFSSWDSSLFPVSLSHHSILLDCPLLKGLSLRA